MCTAATYKTADFYFGRTLDYEFSYGDEVAVLPRNYALAFRHMGTLKAHYAIIGMAYVVGDYPLYYDGINEKGLGMAGLNFVGNAMYQEVVEGRENIAQFEFIPWILAQCASVEEAREKLEKMNLVGTQFGEQLPLEQYSRGMGALGLPGDLSSTSRFARVAFTRLHAMSGESEAESVSQFFHILGSVDQQRGCCEVADGKYEITLYTSCCNATKGIYYYTTYENHQITAVDMHRENLDGETLVHYPVVKGEHILWQN